jgi:hypothetical protein
MRTLRATRLLVLLATSTGLAAGCKSDDGGGCVGDCVCTGTDCTCPSSGDCTIHCGDDCDLSCTGSGNCDFICDVACNVSCSSSGECLADVLGGSTIACTGSGDCEITCRGDCTVDCPGSGVCLVHCLEGSNCEITNCPMDVNECDAETMICNDACP